MTHNPYTTARFSTSAYRLGDLPPDEGVEVAFVGRSNAGKSSAINTLTRQKNLAKTSKTPGRTQCINVFTLDDTRRIMDLPGYGFAKVSKSQQQQWQALLDQYFQSRQSLKGVVLMMDIRHPLKPYDEMMIDYCHSNDVELHILLTKADKLSYSQAKNTLLKVASLLKKSQINASLQVFSATKKTGLTDLIDQLNLWYEQGEPDDSGDE